MLIDALIEASRTSPKTLAVEDATRGFTYSQLALLAGVFREIITEQTSCRRVGILLPASSVFPATLFGAFWAGRVAVPLNFLLSTEELARVVVDAGIDLILTVKPFQELSAGLPARSIFLEDLPLKRRSAIAWLRPLPTVPQPKPEETAVILYTSGTTAEPKGVELTYGNLHSNCVDAISSLRIGTPQVFLNTLPPFHVFGLTGNVLVPIMLRAAVYAIPRFSPMAVIKTTAEKQVSVILAIPSMYAAILKTKSAKREDFASIYLAISGGEPLAESVRTGFVERFGVELRQGYGLTETSPIIAACSQQEHKPGTVGKPVRNVEVRIIGPEGLAAKSGEDGEIQVRGPGVMKGYYKKPEETRKVFSDDGWFKTGDIGRFDAEGYLSITGRLKDMLIIGGENVFAREIEAVLEDFDGVLQAAVIGVPDELRGEAPVAFVLPREGAQLDEQALRSHARQSLAGYKVPKQVIIREDLPKGPTGKILKRRLRELL